MLQRHTSRWYVVLVLVLVLDPIGTGLHQLYFFDYENEDDDEDEKHSYRHFRAAPLLQSTDFEEACKLIEYFRLNVDLIQKDTSSYETSYERHCQPDTKNLIARFAGRQWNIRKI